LGIQVGGSKRGIMSEMNVVPLIDVLLVLLVIFMIIPHKQLGLKAEIPQPAAPAAKEPMPELVVVQVFADGSLKINQQAVQWASLRDRLCDVFRMRGPHGVCSRRRRGRISRSGPSSRRHARR
jgi:biopolymer transport protein TolR